VQPRYLPILALLCASLLAADSITTLQLTNRPAIEIVPIIEPLLEPGDRISGQGFKIFLRASPQTIAEVRQLIASIDIAAKALMISVFQGRRSDLETRDISGSIRLESGKLSGSITAGESRQSGSSGPLHRLRVTEGSEGFIATGVHTGLKFSSGPNVASGFYVRPRLNGDRVTLQISPFGSNAQAIGRSIDILQASTTISGQLGEWLLLGGVDERIERTQGDGASQRWTRHSQQDSIWIRADSLP
jgi:hypothetical protein